MPKTKESIKFENRKTFYVTTAIDYVNAKPHVGHAFEKTLADALARYKRLEGYDVFFLTGVDENAQKNVEAAKKAGIPVKEFIDKNANSFIELCKKLNISYDDFIRTTAKEHAVVVQRLVQKMISKGDIYKSSYKGLYCVGCETYYTEKDLLDGKCPEHNTKPELREEEAYFFKLSKYEKELIKIIPDYVVPKEKANEIISRIKEGLNDICISRKSAKWGIDFPNDKSYKIWVWIDALINYISGLKDKEKKYWPADVHVIGKGINWFHSVIWIAMLLSAEYKLPKKLLVHGYLNTAGKKMSKSLGNVISPLDLLNKYSADSVRYSLLKCSVFDDSDYSEEILIERNNNELADKLGNLVSRVSTLTEKYGIEKCENKLLKKLKLNKIKELLDNYEFDKALILIFEFIDECNNYIQSNELWKSKDKKKLYELIDSIKAVAILLYPFIPESSEKISKLLNFKIQNLEQIEKPIEIKPIKKAEILFKKIEGNKNKKLEQKNIKTSNAKKEGAKMPEQKSNMVEFPEFQKLDIRIGTITEAKQHPNADKLFILKVDFGTETRQIVAGLRKFYTEHELVGKQISVIMNLKPAVLRGVESQGMLLAAEDSEGKVVLLIPEKKLLDNAKIS